MQIWMEQSFSGLVVKVFKPVVILIATIVILIILTLLVGDFKVVVDDYSIIQHPCSLMELKQVNLNPKLLFMRPFTLFFSD